MKCWTISNFCNISRGIKVSKGALSIGEQGRGRVRTIIPALPPLPTEGTITRASVARVAGVSPQHRGDTVKQVETARAVSALGQVVLTGERAGDEGARSLVAFIGDPGYSQGAEYSLPQAPGLRLVAVGRGAYGMAGYCGGWTEALAILDPGTRIELKSKYTKKILLVANDGEVRLLTPEEEAAERAVSSGPEGLQYL